MKKSLEQIQEEFWKIAVEHRGKIKTFWGSLDEESKKGLQYYSATAVGDKNRVSISISADCDTRFVRDVNHGVIKEARTRNP